MINFFPTLFLEIFLVYAAICFVAGRVYWSGDIVTPELPSKLFLLKGWSARWLTLLVGLFCAVLLPFWWPLNRFLGGSVLYSNLLSALIAPILAVWLYRRNLKFNLKKYNQGVSRWYKSRAWKVVKVVYLILGFIWLLSLLTK